MSKKNLLLIWQTAFTYIGAIIGAGFASGQEILRFFGVFGQGGLYGTLLAGLLFSFLGVLIIRAASIKKMRSYEHYIVYLFGSRVSGIVDLIMSISLFCGLIVMLVASGSLFNQLWGLPTWIGFTVTLALLFIVLFLGMEGFLWLNGALVPALIVMCMGVAGAGWLHSDRVVAAITPEINLVGSYWIPAALLYVSYNLILGVVILSSLGDTAKKAGSWGALIGGIILGIMAFIICQSLLYQSQGILDADIPMLALAYRLSPLAGRSYTFVLWAAILTTALCNGFGLLKRLEGLFFWPRPILLIILLIPTLIFLEWPFTKSVGIIYPLLGYIGLILIFAIIIKGWPVDKDY